MKIFKLIFVVILFLNFAPVPKAEAVCYNIVPAWDNGFCSLPPGSWGQYNASDRGIRYENYPPPDYITATCPYVQSGYTCTRFAGSGGFCGGWNGYQCTRNNFSAIQSGAFTLIGRNLPNTVTTYNVQLIFEKPSPFIYFYNAPDGAVEISLDSQLDSYAPLPAFNDEQGWELVAKDSKLTLDGKPVDHVFYELALNKISLSRNGRNFASKEEVIMYLNDSDFLTKLGFSQTEKDNSLGYLVPEIEAAADSEYYYLTVLDAQSVAETGTLTVSPIPDKIVRQYFAVYPTDVPVATTGDFVFPEVELIEGFIVKETGEFLINPSMFVFFK